MLAHLPTCLLLCLAAPVVAGPLPQSPVVPTPQAQSIANASPHASPASAHDTSPQRLRIATFNVALYGNHEGDVLRRLNGGQDSQARKIAGILQRVRPDILLLNELDYDPDGQLLAVLHDQYLAVAQPTLDEGSPLQPLNYDHRVQAPANTGQPSGYDLNRDGRVSGPVGSDAYAADCWGYGRYPGQYAMALLSQHPVEQDQIRTFRTFRWADLPGGQLPDDPQTTLVGDWYPAAARREFPLSSKSHWDISIRIGTRSLHALASHPTPPVFDGPEDRNGLRNRDEIRFWTWYLDSAPGDAPPRDDQGRARWFAADDAFVVLGDLNADPHDGESGDAIAELLRSPRVHADPRPASRGGAAMALREAGVNRLHRGDPHLDTLDASDEPPGPGNLRVDYAIPSSNLRVLDAGVFWPVPDEPGYAWVDPAGGGSSDHRLVWIDVAWPPLGSSPDHAPAPLEAP